MPLPKDPIKEQEAIRKFQMQTGRDPMSTELSGIYSNIYGTDLPPELAVTQMATSGTTNQLLVASKQLPGAEGRVALARTGTEAYTKPTLALNVLQEAIRTKNKAEEADIGPSSVFKQAGVTGYGALEQALEARGNELQTNYAQFANTINTMAGVYKDAGTFALSQYKLALDEYNTLTQRIDTINTSEQDHSNAIELLGIKGDVDKQLEFYKKSVEMMDFETPTERGSISFRTNNPGNIKWGSFAKSLGATDSGIQANDGGTFAQFPDYETGKKAQFKLLQSSSYANLTLDTAMKRWSNKGYGAEVLPEVAPNRKMKELTKGDLETLQQKMQEREGWTPGTAPQSKFTPQFYRTAYGQKVLNNEQQYQTNFLTQPIIKSYLEVQNKAASVTKIIDSGVGGPGDLALVFEFMKGLDPNSVVRETEYATAAKSGNIFKGIWAKFNGYLKEEGGFLPENVKQAFKSIVQTKLDVYQGQYNQLRDQFRKTASEQGLNPDHVAPDLMIEFETKKQSTGLENEWEYIP